MTWQGRSYAGPPLFHGPGPVCSRSQAGSLPGSSGPPFFQGPWLAPFPWVKPASSPWAQANLFPGTSPSPSPRFLAGSFFIGPAPPFSPMIPGRLFPYDSSRLFPGTRARPGGSRSTTSSLPKSSGAGPPFRPVPPGGACGGRRPMPGTFSVLSTASENVTPKLLDLD